jgi:protein SCO1
MTRALLVVLCLLSAATAWAQPTPLKGVRLLDQQARPLAPAALQGQLVLMHFVFTGCSSICPLQVKELLAVHQALPPAARDGVRFLSVSVDPMNDTPASMAAFARRMGADVPGWHFATGEPAQVDVLIDRMRALDTRQARPAPEDHRTTLFLFDGRGDLLQHYSGVPVDRARLLREITQLAQQASTLSARR